MSRFVLAAGRLFGAIILMVAAVDYQQLAIRRCAEQLTIRHLLLQTMPTELPKFVKATSGHTITVLPFEADPQQLVAGQFHSVLAERGIVKFRWSTPGPTRQSADGSCHTPQQPAIMVRGRVEQLALSPIDSARLRLHVSASAAGESTPRYVRTFDVVANRELFLQELADRMAWVIPRWIPQVGGIVVPLDQKTLAAIPILVGLMGAVILRSRSTFLTLLFLSGLLAIALHGFLTPVTELHLHQHVLWTVLVVGAGVLAGVANSEEHESTEDNPERQRYPRLVPVR